MLNVLFTGVYVALGTGALDGAQATSRIGWFGEAFFFSVYTLATIGYGDVTPATWQADVVATLESLAGLLTFGLAAGIMFARFAQPNARIIFSHNAIIAPYREGTAFEFRIVNSRKNQIIDVNARVILSKHNPDGRDRTYQELPLERQKVAIFPLAWTIVHPIGDSSPLQGVTAADLEQCEAEFLIGSPDSHPPHPRPLAEVRRSEKVVQAMNLGESLIRP